MTDDAIDRSIQTYDSRFSLDDRTRHSALAVELLDGPANRCSAAREELQAAIQDAESASPVSLQLLNACDRDAEMATAALEYQIRINTHILGYSEGNSPTNLFGGS